MIKNITFDLSINDIKALSCGIIIAKIDSDNGFYIIFKNDLWYACRYLDINGYSYKDKFLKDLCFRLIKDEGVKEFKFIEL